MTKIRPLHELGKISNELKARGKVVVHCHGTFDLMHPGHVRYFEEAKRLGDVLVVTVTADRFVRKGVGKPVFHEQLRAESIAALTCVDYVAVDPHEFSQEAIQILQPAVYAKGSDYEGKENEDGHPTAREKQWVERAGGRMHFTHDPVTFSSTELLNDHFSAMPENVRAFLASMRAEHSDADFQEIFSRMGKIKALVIGDAILDVYHYSNFLGRSVKEEIPRVRVIGTETFLGGSLAVGNTLAGFCDTVGIVAVLGGKDAEREKHNERLIRDRLKKNVHPEFFYRDDAPTVVNERFVNNEPYIVDKKTKVNMRKYFGLYHINDTPVEQNVEKEWLRRIKEISSGFDLIIVTDYGLGMLSPALIAAITQLPTFLAVNTQTNSINYGFNLITKYPRADYVSVSQPELRLALHDKHTDVQHLVEKIMKVIRVKTVAVTLGALGVLMHDERGSTAVPALSTSVIDNIGAGDAFFALSALGLQMGLPRALSGFLGAAASALSVGIIANRETVDRQMLSKTIQSLLKSSKSARS